MTAYVWGIWDQNISPNHIIDSSEILCWAAKWLGEKEIMFDSVHQSKPKTMLKNIHSLVNEADAVIHYNGAKFDMPTLNKEFLLHGMTPPSPYKQVDLLRTMRSTFKFPSNKLDYISQRLGLGKKIEHKGMELWTECLSGDKDAWKIMEKYNKQDVVLLEQVYNRVLPWIKHHPNRNLFADAHCCPTCGSSSLQKRGQAVTTTVRYQRYQCKDCGTWSQSTKAETKTVQIKGLV
jgi:hypothetical protein